MKLFHRHHWAIIQTTFVPPVLYSGSIKHIDPDSLTHMLTPHSYVTLQCSECGDLKEKEMHGEAKPQITIKAREPHV